MGLFYKAVPTSAPALAAAASRAAAASASEPREAGAGPLAEAAARPVGAPSAAVPPLPPDIPASSPPPPPLAQLSVGRLALAVGFLVLILAAGLFASRFHIKPWDSVLPSAFQLLVGAVVGAVIGEKIGTGT